MPGLPFGRDLLGCKGICGRNHYSHIAILSIACNVTTLLLSFVVPIYYHTQNKIQGFLYIILTILLCNNAQKTAQNIPIS